MLEQQIQLDAKALRQTLNELKQLDPDSTKQLRSDFKIRLLPFANAIANQVPTESPFKGMNRNYYGAVQWAQPSGKVSATPGRGTGNRGWANILTIIIENKKALGFAYTENAGTRRKSKKPMSKTYQRHTDSVVRQHRNTTQGDALIQKARQASKNDFKSGHFAYGFFLSQRPMIIAQAQLVLKKVMKRYNKKVER